MSVIQNIKKIFRSYDFKGNRILNAKVNKPESDEAIANRKYVDDLQRYNSTLITEKKDSTTFDWMTSLVGLSITEIFDKLFFNISYPTFSNPTIESLTYTLVNSQVAGTKYIVFNDLPISGIITYTISSNSRVANTTAKIIVLYSDNTTLEFEDTNNSGLIIFDFPYVDGCKITFTQIYASATPVIVDEEEYIDPDFTDEYILSEDITKKLNDNFIIFDAPLISNDFLDTQSTPTYLEADIPTLFTKSLFKTVDTDSEVIIDFLIPQNLIDKSSTYKYPFKFILLDENNSILFNIIIPTDLLTKYTNNATITYNDIVYYKYQYNFGLLGVNGKLMFNFSMMFNSDFIN